MVYLRAGGIFFLSFSAWLGRFLFSKSIIFLLLPFYLSFLCSFVFFLFLPSFYFFIFFFAIQNAQRDSWGKWQRAFIVLPFICQLNLPPEWLFGFLFPSPFPFYPVNVWEYILHLQFCAFNIKWKKKKGKS